MESSESFNPFPAALPRERNRRWIGLLKAAIGVGLLAALFYSGQIDLKVLAALVKAPTAVAIALALLLLPLPLAALRWGILLRTFGLPVPFIRLYHFVAIGTLANLFLLGGVGGDAVRLFYAWRTLGRGAGRIAISILADRALALLALMSIVVVFTLANWSRIQQVPALAALAISLLSVYLAAVLGGLALLLAPTFARVLRKRLARWPRLAKLTRQIHDVVLMVRGNPAWWSAAFVLAVASQICTLGAIVLIAQVLNIGTLAASDYLFATPLTLIANALPLTPNGLGVGEIAFDQICRWLEPQRSEAAYSSIFFAFRALGAFGSLLGLVSFAIYRSPLRPDGTH